jgi:hypothetical protein
VTSRALQHPEGADVARAQPAPWDPDALDADGRDLAQRVRAEEPDLRRRARAALRLAFLSAAAARESGEGDTAWRADCFRASRDLERLLRLLRREPLPERSWLRHGRLVTIRTMRPVRIRSGIRWRLVDDVLGRFVGFGDGSEAWREWLWTRIERNAPPEPQPHGPGASHREGYELVYGRGRRDDT